MGRIYYKFAGMPNRGRERLPNAKTSTNSTFLYDANQQRIKQVTGTTGKSETVLNVSPAFQVTYSDVGVGDRLTQYKHSLYVGDKVVAIQVRTLKNGVGIPDEMRYLHHDALGNVDTLTNGSGKVIQRLAYDPFGKRSVTFGMDADQKAWTAQGFTGHEHLDGLGLIDMNARLYDPEIGRFLSADTLIPDAGLMHSYNRYIYVLNNPLKYTDPSGHNWISDRWEDFTNSMNQAAGWVRDNCKRSRRL